jgi:glycine/D-amino acid oxidase-like deaminating enzyme
MAQETYADVTVVGSGLPGLATAFELLDRGLVVAVVGPRTGAHEGQASRAAGAMLTVFSEVESTHPADRVAVEVRERLAARDGYEAWLDRIGAASGRGIDLTTGVWVIANGYGADDAAQLKTIAAAAEAQGHRAEFASPRDVPGLLPQIRAHEALWLPHEASLDPTALMDALVIVLHAHPQCHWIDATATGVREQGEHLVVDASDGSSTLSAHLVLAAGAGISGVLGTGDLARQVAAPPVRSGRGVSLLLRAPFALPAAIRTPNRGFACGSHVVPRGSDIYLGATNRLSTDPDYQAKASLDEIATLIHDGTAELHTGLRDAALLEVRVGHRPVTIDHLPVVGRSAHPMVHLATATYRCGVLLAPRIAGLIADGITTPGRHDDRPYSPRRPIAAPALEEFVDSSARGLVEMICQPGGQLPAGGEEKLAAFLRAGLLELAAGGSTRAAVVRRLWSGTPMAECVPLLMDAAGRLP